MKQQVSWFEDLIAWQKARGLTKRIYLVTNAGGFSRDFGLRDQIRRASISTMSNIAEGFERNSTADFRRFLYMAKASCAEVRSQLYVGSEVGYLNPEELTDLMARAEELARVLGGLLISLERRMSRQAC